MILSSTPCEPEQLPSLLAGDLPPKAARRLEDHLSNCPHCQRELERIAGERHWWQTTETALRSMSVANAGSLANANAALDKNAFANANGASLNETAKSSAAATVNSRSVDEHDTSRWLRKIAPDGMLGPFRLEASIGHGGTGIVAQAIDTQLNRRVAVKVLYPHLASSGAARQRFAREAQAAAAVVHPSVVPIHAVDAEHDPPYLVMTFVPGGSLQQRLDRHGPLELVELLRIALQIAEGLAAAHAQGLVHRDVKPANILLEAGTDRVLLTDFGLARALDDATLTASGYVSGTPPYMSPEQARGDAIDCRSDLFSVGSLMFAMATGRAPYQGNSALNILRQVNESPTQSVRAINERMPAWLDRLIAMTHAKSPSQRVASAEILAELVRQCLAHVQTPNVFSLPKELKSRSHATFAWTLVGMLSGAMIGLAGGAWYASNPFHRDTLSNKTQGHTYYAVPGIEGNRGIPGNANPGNVIPSSGAALNTSGSSAIENRDESATRLSRSMEFDAFDLRVQEAQIRAGIENIQRQLEEENHADKL